MKTVNAAPVDSHRGLFGFVSLASATARFIRLFIWLSPAAPFVAVAVIYIVRFNELAGWWSWLWDWLGPNTQRFTEVKLTWRYAFLASGFIGLLALTASLVLREKRLVWIAVTGIALTILFAKLTLPWSLIL
jgi:hypothetical protein